MKTKGIIVAIILNICALTGFAQGNTPFKSFLENGRIGSSFISKSMLDMAPDLKIGATSISKIANILDQIEIYTNPTDASKIRFPGYLLYQNAVVLLDRVNYELLLKLDKKQENIAFYTKKIEKKSDKFSELIVITTNSLESAERGDCTIIRLVGNFTINDIKKIISQ